MFTKKSTDRIADFTRNQRGSISVLTVLTMVPFMIAAGTAVDMGRVNRTLVNMQKAVDTAALAAAATQGTVAVADGQPLTGDEAKIHVAMMMVEANLPEQIKSAAAAPQVVINGDEVVVNLSADMATSFMKLVGVDSLDLNVTAAAKAHKDAQACVLALAPDGSGIQVGGNVDLSVAGCWLHSNKEGEKSIDVVGQATIDAGGSCSVGSTSVTGEASLSGRRLVNCSPLADPQADWTPPTAGETCDHTNFNQNAGPIKSIILFPGVYCGGLQLSGYDNVDLMPGIYHIESGPLTINSKVALTGVDVGFHLANDVTGVTINGSAAVSLSADDDGEMGGLLFAMEPGATSLITAKINGGSDLQLEGTIYLPTGELEISGNSTTLSTAAQIIAHSIKLAGTSSLSFEPQLDEFGNPIGGEFVSLVRLIR